MKLFGVLFLACFLTVSQVVSETVDYDYSQTEEYYDDIGEDNPGEPVVEEPPPVFTERSRRLTVREGESLDLSCKTVAPTERVLLFKKESPEQGDKKKQLVLFAGSASIFKSNFKSKDSTYSIKQVNRKDAASYLCVYQTSFGDIQIKYEINVEYSPHIRPMKAMGSNPMKGDNISFECKADGNPKPTVKWSREHGKLPSGTTEEKGKTIIFMDVDRHVEGTYVCTAENGIGKAAVASRKLVVLYPPEIITEKEIIRTGEGDKVELVCIVHSRPHAAVTWFREDRPLIPDNNTQEINGGHRHSLTISQITEKDFGTYTCTAINNIGNVSADINLTDLPMKPQFTSDPTSADATKYTLAWTTESFYPVTEYRIKYRLLTANASDESSWTENSFEMPAVDAENVTLTHKMKHIISDLKAATDYEAVVSVKNELKWGDISSFQFSTKKESASHITGAGSVLSTSILLLVTSRIVSVIS